MGRSCPNSLSENLHLGQSMSYDIWHLTRGQEVQFYHFLKEEARGTFIILVSLDVVFLQLRITWVESLSREIVIIALTDVGRPMADTHGSFCQQHRHKGTQKEDRRWVSCSLSFPLPLSWFTLLLLLPIDVFFDAQTNVSRLPTWTEDPWLFRKPPRL